MTPRLTTTWKNRATQVVAYITGNPGATGKEISYNTGVALSTVHLIIRHDPRAFSLACEGKIAILDRNIKPKWYHPSMTLVPIVKRDRLDPSAQFREMLDEQNLDPKAQRLVGQVIDMVSMGIANPTRSVNKRRREAVAIVSNTQLLGIGYTEMKAEKDTVIPRLAHVEKMLLRLTASESLEETFGKSQLRKTVRS